MGRPGAERTLDTCETHRRSIRGCGFGDLVGKLFHRYHTHRSRILIGRWRDDRHVFGSLRFVALLVRIPSLIPVLPGNFGGRRAHVRRQDVDPDHQISDVAAGENPCLELWNIRTGALFTRDNTVVCEHWCLYSS